MRDEDEQGVLVIVTDETGGEQVPPSTNATEEPVGTLPQRLRANWAGPIRTVSSPDDLATFLADEPTAFVAVDVPAVAEAWPAWTTALGLDPATRRLPEGVDDAPVVLIGDDRYWPRIAEALAASRADCVRLPCDDVELRARLRAAERVFEVREHERAALARALHDDPIQVIAASTMRLQLLRRRLPADASADTLAELDDVAEHLQQGLERLRTLEFGAGHAGPAPTPAPAAKPAITDDAVVGIASVTSSGPSLWASRELLSKLGHDLRSPLNAVLGFAQLLEMSPDLPPDHTDPVRQIIRAGQRLLELINEVVDLSRIEAGVLDLSLEPVELDELVRDAADLMQPAAADGGVRLGGLDRRGWTSSDSPVTVMADRQRLLQVLLILLSNAVRYNRPDGRVDLDVSRRTPATVRVTITDTGRGIAPDKLDKVFVPFDRLGVDKQGPDGAGLGLPIARGLLARMGGHLGVDSTLGQGSTFWFELRVAPEQAAGDPLAGADDQHVTVPDERPFEVLYVEDNPSSLRLVEQVLRRRSGVTMIPAMQGRLGLQLAQQRQPSMVLVDLHLPDMAGVDVVRSLVADPTTRHIPVVVLSADANRDQETRLVNEGARGYLSKPFQIDTLLDLVDTLRSEEAARAASIPGTEAAGSEPVPAEVHPG